MNQSLSNTPAEATPISNTLGAVASSLDRAADKIVQAGTRVGDVTHRSAQKLDASTQQAKVRLNEMSSSAIAYVKDEPVRAMLIAAGVGAALVALASVLGRARD